MTDLFAPPASVTSSRGRLKAAVPILAVLAVVGVLAAFILVRNRPAERRLTAIFIEPGTGDPARLAADVNAELDDAIDKGSDVMVAGVLDGKDATSFIGSFTCGSTLGELECEAHRDALAEKATAAAGTVLSRGRPAAVDVLAPFRQLAAHLDASPSDGSVEMFLNVSGRSTDPAVDLSSPNLPGRVDAVVAAAQAGARFPRDLHGAVVHLVMPTSGDPAHDAAVAEILRRLVVASNGSLPTVSQRWLPDEQALPLPDFEVAGVSAVKQGRTVTFTLGEALFDTGSAGLRPDAVVAVDGVAAAIRARTDVLAVQVVGFADATGTSALNDALSTNRAVSVAAALRPRLAPTVTEVSSRGAGSVPDDGTPEGRQRNRRVDVIVTTKHP